MESGTARTQELWPLLKARLNSARMQQILGGANRIKHAPPDVFANPEGPEGTVWGRMVLLQTTQVWAEVVGDDPDIPRNIHFLLRAEFPMLNRTDYDPTISLEAAHAEAFTLLQGYAPTTRADGSALKYMTMAEAVYRFRSPSDPMPDDNRSLWVASAEYRCRISNDVPPS